MAIEAWLGLGSRKHPNHPQKCLPEDEIMKKDEQAYLFDGFFGAYENSAFVTALWVGQLDPQATSELL